MNNKENEVIYLHLDDIIPNRFQPRQVFDERALKELALSIKEHGVIQPIIVRNIGNKYEIIAGERRYKASAMAGLTTIPAIIRDLDDKETSKVALLENLQRKNLNPIEEAKTYQKILELDQMTQENLAKTMGKSQGAVANKLRLLSLTDEVQDALLKEKISERHARTLLSVKDNKEQKKLLKEIMDNKLTVRELEEKIKSTQNVEETDFDKILNEQSNQVSNNQFNNSVGIDYSTPPKFIDYDIKDINSNLETTAKKVIDINTIKDNAKDIFQSDEPKEKEEIDNLISPPPIIETTENNSDFKFFAPIGDDVKPTEEESKVSLLQEQAPIENNIIDDNPFKLNEETKNIYDQTSTSMDNLLAGVTIKNTDESNKMIDTFNNPFASNPIFSDNIKEQEENTLTNKPKYNLNESIDLVRKTLKEIEESGFTVDSDETDLANSYQIVIKITKQDNS